MNEQGFARCLIELLNGEIEFDDPSNPHGISDATSYEEAGVLTNNAGLVVRMDDGSEYQITIVRSRWPPITGHAPIKETAMSKKTTKKTAAKSRADAPETKAAKPTKEKKPKPPRESRDGWGTFALKLPVPEREAFHAAAGPAGASRVARVVLNAFANGDEGAFKTAINEAREARQ